MGGAALGVVHLNVLSRYLSHALVLAVALAVGAYVAPTALSANSRTGSSPVTQAFADASLTLPGRTAIPAAGCAAPPTIPSGASFDTLRALRDRVQTRMSGCASRVESLNRQLRTLNAQIDAGSRRIAAEQRLLAGLAGTMYRQPSSVLVALTSSSSLGDFLTRIADLESAGARARDLTARLQADQEQLQADRTEVAAALRQESSTRAALTAASARLQELEAQELSQYSTAPALYLPVGPQQVIQDIENAFQPLGQTAVQWGLRVARCESGYNPNAVNPYSGTEGLFQFMPSTWRSTPYGRDNVFDPKWDSLGAAWLYQHDGPSQWQCG